LIFNHDKQQIVKTLSVNIIFFLCLGVLTPGYGRDTLSLTTYLDRIADHYPLIKKANIYEDIADAYVLQGRGAFDPVISSSYQSKQYEETNYFTVWQTDVKIPTRLPLDFSLGYENNDGTYLNPENTVPQNGLIYGTVNLSLLRGLMFDPQRYTLQTAALKGVKSSIEKDLLTRDVFYQALLTYLEWAGAQIENNVLRNYRDAVQERHVNIIGLVMNGDKPTIDTIESRMILNTATKMFLESTQRLITARQKVELFLWNADGQPLALIQDIQPEPLENLVQQLENFTAVFAPGFDNDPLLRKIQNEIDLMEVERQLEKQNFLPRVDLKYNTIVTPGDQSVPTTFSVNNYKFGFGVEVPILNRKAKGAVRFNEYVIEQNRQDYMQYRKQLMNTYANLLLNKGVQMDIIEVGQEKIENCQALYQAENIKFEMGESSVFMVNQRERSLLEAKMDLAGSYLRMGKTLTELYYLRLGQI
jgi:outer membrane protein TolC